MTAVLCLVFVCVASLHRDNDYKMRNNTINEATRHYKNHRHLFTSTKTLLTLGRQKETREDYFYIYINRTTTEGPRDVGTYYLFLTLFKLLLGPVIYVATYLFNKTTTTANNNDNNHNSSILKRPPEKGLV